MLSLLQIILFWVLFDVLYIGYRLLLLTHHHKYLRIREFPLVTLLIPAYNEEVCIEKTLASALNQTYPKLEIIVINDGSTDRTMEMVNRFHHHHHQLLRSKGITFEILNQPNKGKAKALNNGLKHARGSFLVTIDADSYLHAHAIEKIMIHFSDDHIGAVAGNIVALSQHKLIGYLQKMEYDLGIHFIRESQSKIGTVMVTPGALSAYRKKAIVSFEEGTLTEDFDSSVRVLERHYDIVLAPDAICYTQVPLGISDLIKQRIRWQQGGLEVFSKHLYHPKRASVSLEWVFLFLFGFYALFGKLLALFAMPLFFVSRDFFSFFLFLLAFFVYSIVIYGILFSLVAYHTHDKRSLFAVPLFIVYYHTIVLYAVLVAQILVLKKNEQSWEKIKRYPI